MSLIGTIQSARMIPHAIVQCAPGVPYGTIGPPQSGRIIHIFFTLGRFSIPRRHSCQHCYSTCLRPQADPLFTTRLPACHFRSFVRLQKPRRHQSRQPCYGSMDSPCDACRPSNSDGRRRWNFSELRRGQGHCMDTSCPPPATAVLTTGSPTTTVAASTLSTTTHRHQKRSFDGGLQYLEEQHVDVFCLLLMVFVTKIFDTTGNFYVSAIRYVSIHHGPLTHQRRRYDFGAVDRLIFSGSVCLVEHTDWPFEGTAFQTPVVAAPSFRYALT